MIERGLYLNPDNLSVYAADRAEVLIHMDLDDQLQLKFYHLDIIA